MFECGARGRGGSASALTDLKSMSSSAKPEGRVMMFMQSSAAPCAESPPKMYALPLITFKECEVRPNDGLGDLILWNLQWTGTVG